MIRTAICGKRLASTISARDDAQLVRLLTRLGQFDARTQIFDQLDTLYNLTQRKGLFDSQLGFLANDSRVQTKIDNMNHFHNIGQLIQSSSGNNNTGIAIAAIGSPSAKTAAHTTSIDASLGRNASPGGLNLVPMPRQASTSSNPSGSAVSGVKGLPGLNLFGNLNQHYPRARYDKRIESHIQLINDLAKNDTELKAQIDIILNSFDHEDDFFFQYVLEFWYNGKAFNKHKAQQIENDTGRNLSFSNLTTQ